MHILACCLQSCSSHLKNLILKFFLNGSKYRKCVERNGIPFTGDMEVWRETTDRNRIISEMKWVNWGI